MIRRWLARVARTLPLLVLLPGNIGQHHMRYDAQGRLVGQCKAFAGEGQLSRYFYDAAGNRTRYGNSRTDNLLRADTGLYSPNGRMVLWMQSDGNLVVYGDLGRGVEPLGWASNTVGSGAMSAYFQSDGNLVLYTPQGQSAWSSGTHMHPCATLAVANDGNVTITAQDGQIVWATNTGGH